MLLFFPAITPWKYVYDSAVENIPTGTFYLKADETLPRSIKPNEFWLVTDHFVPVQVYVNGAPSGTIIPSTKLARVMLNLHEPPLTNIITVDNGIDAQVNLSVVITHIAKEIEVAVRELYEYAQRTNELYADWIASPWSSFFASYQLPWRRELPDIRSLNIMAVKALSRVLFNESGTKSGVPDVVSAFTCTTPVVMAPQNPELFQPDLYQPHTSGFDNTGFDFHVWAPNLCLSRWSAAVKLVSNLSTYDFSDSGEETLTFAAADTDNYNQHLLFNMVPGCSLYDLLIAEGCMDAISVVGAVSLTADFPICAYANPFDGVVEIPGIGGSHFDSGALFDGGYGDFDSVYDIDVLTDYWAATPLVKRFDYGKCLDSWPTVGYLPEDTSCCQEGPDTVVLSTVAISASVVSATTPIHPLFGGDDPGILANPYFGLLY